MVSQKCLPTIQSINKATNLECHQSQSHWCVCAKCGVEVPMVAMPHTMPHTHLVESHEQPNSQEEGRQVSEWPDGRHASGPCVVDGNAM